MFWFFCILFDFLIFLSYCNSKLFSQRIIWIFINVHYWFISRICINKVFRRIFLTNFFQSFFCNFNCLLVFFYAFNEWRWIHSSLIWLNPLIRVDSFKISRSQFCIFCLTKLRHSYFYCLRTNSDYFTNIVKWNI